MSIGLSRISPTFDLTATIVWPFPRKKLPTKKKLPLEKTEIKTLYKISTEQKLDRDKTQEENLGEQDFPPQYLEIKEGKWEINESKEQEWMDASIKIKEVNIANEGQPKMARIGDYWLEQQMTEIVDLLKEY